MHSSVPCIMFTVQNCLLCKTALHGQIYGDYIVSITKTSAECLVILFELCFVHSAEDL